jgi:HSF-type DNA-binding
LLASKIKRIKAGSLQCDAKFSPRLPHSLQNVTEATNRSHLLEASADNSSIQSLSPRGSKIDRLNDSLDGSSVVSVIVTELSPGLCATSEGDHDVAESCLTTFPENLMSLLDGDYVKDIMWWLPDGDAFCFIPEDFAANVLDKYFQGTKFESFTRKLNRW